MASASRKSRYVPTGRTLMVSPNDREALNWVARLGVVSMPQLVRLLGRGDKAVQKTMRRLFDGLLAHNWPLPVNALADDPRTLQFGSAPNAYSLTPEGARFLEVPAPKRFQASSMPYWAHTLQVREVVVWAVLCSLNHGLREPGFELQTKPLRGVTPDAVLALRPGTRVMVGLVEVDRGTERGAERWNQKFRGYSDLLISGKIGELLGTPALKHARVLVIVPTKGRLEKLSELVQQHPAFWFTLKTTLQTDDLTCPLWVNEGQPKPLLAPEYLA